MTCNKTLHGRFVSGLHTPVVLFVLSLLLMLSAFWLPAPAASLQLPAEPLQLGTVASRIVSLLLFAVSAAIVSGQIFFDRRVRWMGAFYLWLVAVMTFANCNIAIAFTSLLFVLSIAMLLACQHAANPVRLLFVSFMILGILSLAAPCALWLLPLYLAFCFFANIVSPRNFVAAFLGVATPFWLLLGTAYVLPGVSEVSDAFMDNLSAILEISAPAFSPLSLLHVVLALSLMFPALVVFVGSASPAKPLLRRRLLFVMTAAAYLLLLSCFVTCGEWLFRFWQLPCLAVLASYIFSGKVTKLSNVYFVLVNIIMVAMATQWLWLRH